MQITTSKLTYMIQISFNRVAFPSKQIIGNERFNFLSIYNAILFRKLSVRNSGTMDTTLYACYSNLAITVILSSTPRCCNKYSFGVEYSFDPTRCSVICSTRQHCKASCRRVVTQRHVSAGNCNDVCCELFCLISHFIRIYLRNRSVRHRPTGYIT